MDIYGSSNKAKCLVRLFSDVADVWTPIEVIRDSVP